MGILEDVIKALERIPAWKRVTALPDEIAQLRARVAALEAKLAPATGDACPKCRTRNFTLTESRRAPPPWGEAGAMEDVWRCSHCNYERIDSRDPR